MITTLFFWYNEVQRKNRTQCWLIQWLNDVTKALYIFFVSLLCCPREWFQPLVFPFAGRWLPVVTGLQMSSYVQKKRNPVPKPFRPGVIQCVNILLSLAKKKKKRLSFITLDLLYSFLILQRKTEVVHLLVSESFIEQMQKRIISKWPYSWENIIILSFLKKLIFQILKLEVFFLKWHYKLTICLMIYCVSYIFGNISHC